MRKLTEKQEAFLEALFHEDVQGDAFKAKMMAGYASDTSTTGLVESLKDEILEKTKTFLAQLGPQAAYGLYSTMTSPTSLGTKEKLKAVVEVLDRIGIVKTEKVDVTTSSSPIFILPEKNDGQKTKKL